MFYYFWTVSTGFLLNRVIGDWCGSRLSHKCLLKVPMDLVVALKTPIGLFFKEHREFNRASVINDYSSSTGNNCHRIRFLIITNEAFSGYLTATNEIYQFSCVKATVKVKHYSWWIIHHFDLCSFRRI